MINSATILAIFLSLMLAGCASMGEKDPHDEKTLENAPAERLFSEAKNALAAGDYETAIQTLESLEARFPFGVYAQQAQLEIAYAYYKYDEPESAVAAADRFIKLYPRHPKVDYAHYLKGIIKFNQGKGAFDFLESQSPYKRDPQAMDQAFRFFRELIERFPNSQYANDAQDRMRYLRDNLAKQEIYVAEYYMKRQAYLAAATRAQHVIKYFQTTSAVEDALVVLVRSYIALDMKDLAANSMAVLELNFPESNKTKNTRRFYRSKTS